MGYGGIVKKVIRVAVPIAVSILIPGASPWVIAMSSAAATGATGGSFKESLMAGATSYISASVSESINASVQAGAPSSGDLGWGGPTAADYGGAAEGLGSSASFLDQAAYGANQALDNVTGNTFAKFMDVGSTVDQGLGGVIKDGVNMFKTPWEYLQAAGEKGLGMAAASAAAPQSILGAVGGLATGYTLNSALLADTPEADQALIDDGYTPQQIVLLKQEARNALSQQAFNRLTGPESSISNPFGDSTENVEEYNKILASGIDRANANLGPSVTQGQFENIFNDPSFGQSILQDETDLRRQSFLGNVDQAFSGNAFQSTLDDDIINSIVQERAAPARQEISNFAARGNLNATGGMQANDFLTQQEGKAKETVTDVGQSVLGGYQKDVDAVRDTAASKAGSYNLGDDLFDVTPFSEQRSNIVEERSGNLLGDINQSIGSEPLFNTGQALATGGRAQGVVSGQPTNQTFLDTLAARQAAAASTESRRGLGTKGSGVF